MMEQTIAALQSQMTASNNELASMKTNQLTTESELTSVRSRLHRTESDLTTVKSQLTSAQTEINVLRQGLAKSPDPNEYKQMKTDLALLRVQYTTFTSHLNAAVMDTIHNAIEHIRTSAQKNAVDIAGLKTELSSELKKVKSPDTDVNFTKTLCQKTLSDLKSLNSNISGLSKEVTTITGRSTTDIFVTLCDHYVCRRVDFVSLMTN